ELRIDPRQHPAVLADVATGVSGEIAQRLQDQADLVEVVGDRVTASLQPGLQPGSLPLQSQRPLGPPRMHVPLGAAMTGMALQGRATLLNLRKGFRIDTIPPLVLAIKINLAKASPEGRCEVATRGRILR